MARSEATWVLEIEGYAPDSLKSVEIQAAWNADEPKLILYLVNKYDEDALVSLDLSPLGRSFRRARARRMSAPGGRVQETVKCSRNVAVECRYSVPNTAGPDTWSVPAWSFTEVILE
jgi:hypothetical protein